MSFFHDRGLPIRSERLEFVVEGKGTAEYGVVTQVSCEERVFVGKLLVTAESVEVLGGCLSPLKGSPPDIRVAAASYSRTAT